MTSEPHRSPSVSPSTPANKPTTGRSTDTAPRDAAATSPNAATDTPRAPRKPTRKSLSLSDALRVLTARREIPAFLRRFALTVRNAWDEGGVLRRWFADAPSDYTWQSAIFDLAMPLTVCLLSLTTSAASQYNLIVGLIPDSAERLVNALWSLALLLPVVLRRLRPAVSATAFVIVVALQLLFGPNLIYMDFLCFPMIYTITVYGPHSKTRLYTLVAVTMAAAASVIGGFTAACATYSYGILNPDEWTTGWWITSCITAVGHKTRGIWSVAGQYIVVSEALVMLSTVMGVWRRTNRESVALLRERNAVLQSQEADAAREAAIRERARIARDMHDVVAHTLSTIIIQADAGRYVGPSDRRAAVRIMATIRRETRHAQHDMNQLLGVLAASDDDTGTVAERVGYDGIADLVAQAQTASPLIEVTRSVEGEARPEKLSGNASICAYRVVQEALTNVRKYAHGSLFEGDSIKIESEYIVHTTIAETWDEDGLHIEVRDDGAGGNAAADGHAGGFGLMGMRERVTTVGGTMESGPRADVDGGNEPGFVVRVFLPYEVRGEREDAKVNPVEITNVDVPHSIVNPEQSQTTASESADSAERRRLPVFARLGNSRATWVATLRHRNMIEHLAAWSMRHVMASDVVMIVVALVCKFAIYSIILGPADLADESSLPLPVLYALMALPCLPLFLRRTRPQLCCFLVFALCIVECSFTSVMSLTDVAPVTIALYSGAVYGKRGFGKTMVGLSIVGSLYFGFCLIVSTFSITFISDVEQSSIIPSVYDILSQFSPAALISWVWTAIKTHNLGSALVGPVVYTVVSLVTCFISIALGFQVRSRENNYVLLSARHEALKSETTAREAAAAVAERTRISAHIQQEITETLDRIARMADDGAVLVASSDTTNDEVADAFRSIGAQGRTALRRMRELLGVLRSTSGDFDSMDATAGALPEHELRPAKPIAEQLHDTVIVTTMKDSERKGKGEKS